MLKPIADACKDRNVQCSPASLPKGPGSPVATLSCDSAASAPCGTRGATPPPPTISTWRVNRATPAAAAVVVVLAAAAVVAAAASHAAGAEVEVQWNLWEPTHCLLPPHSSAEAQNSLQRPHPAEPADGSIFNQFSSFRDFKPDVDKIQVVDPLSSPQPQLQALPPGSASTWGSLIQFLTPAHGRAIGGGPEGKSPIRSID